MNKLGDAELKAHKKAMDVGFEKNAVKKGDAGFQYDKRVNFKYKAEEALDNSWDEDEDESDDDDGVEVIASSAVKSKPKGVGLLNKSPPRQDPTYEEFNDNDYFDDDFDDDFQ